MEPITRSEQYLASIIGEEVELPVPQSRIEHYLNIIAQNGVAPSSAGLINYDPDADYPDGSIGKEVHELDGDVSTLKSALNEVEGRTILKSSLAFRETAYNNAGAGTITGNVVLTIQSGITVTSNTRIGRACLAVDESFIGKKILFKPKFVITGDKSVFTTTLTHQTGYDATVTILNRNPESIEMLVDFTNATHASVSTYYLYALVNGNNTVTSSETTLAYIDSEIYEYIDDVVENVASTQNSNSKEIELISQRIDGTELEMTAPTFVSNAGTGVTVDETERIATATQDVATQFYLGYRYSGASYFTKGELLLVEYDFTATGTTKWKPFVFPASSDKFALINASVSENKASFLFRITDDSLNFLVFCVQHDGGFNSGDSIQIGNVTATDLSLKNYIASSGLNYYTDKELTCFGDSYTMMGYWQPTVCKELKMNPFTDVWGQSGGTLTSIYSQINTINTDADVVTVWIGTNDYAGNRAVGELNDTVETIVGGYPTFAGALNYVCDWLAKNMAGKTVVFITPTYRHDTTDDTFEINNGKNAEGYIKNNAGFVLADYADIMVAVANKWGYPCLDLFHVSGINEYTYSAYYGTDRLHPSRAGAVLLGHKIAMFIIQQ